ncbi:MAG: TlpA family protein disulfide reductase [Deltaproteobacteria bacterium]|nr:TlpA family protein disulfide reductase [Deltaproteobacteria bacterium]
MRRALGLLAVLLPLLAGAVAVGDQAPEFRLKDLEGRERSLSDLREGGAIVLDFGSVYCASCQEVLRRLEALRREQKPGGPRVAVVNVDPPWAEKVIQSVMKGLRAGYPVVRDLDGTTADAYGVKQIPHLVAVDAEGIIRAVHEGLPANLEQALQLDALGAPERK